MIRPRHDLAGCEGCEQELRLADSYAAEEGGRELEVIVLLCTSCGERTELIEPLVA